MNAEGHIHILGQRFKVGKRLKFQYIIATLYTKRKMLGSLGFRVERPHMGVLRLGKSAIAFKVKVKTLE